MMKKSDGAEFYRYASESVGLTIRCTKCLIIQASLRGFCTQRQTDRFSVFPGLRLDLFNKAMNVCISMFLMDERIPVESSFYTNESHHAKTDI